MPESTRVILLVEDDPDHEMLTIRALKKSNIANDVRVARDGEEALEALFGPGQASKPRQRGRSKGSGAHGCSQPHKEEEQAPLSGAALVRLCRGLQEEVRRKERELITCKAWPAIAYIAGLKTFSSHGTHSIRKLLSTVCH